MQNCVRRAKTITQRRPFHISATRTKGYSCHDKTALSFEPYIDILRMSNILRFLQTDHDTKSPFFSFITKESSTTKPSVVADHTWKLDRVQDLTQKGIATAFYHVTFPLLSSLGHCLRNKTYCNKATVFRVERSASTVCNDKHSIVAREIPC